MSCLLLTIGLDFSVSGCLVSSVPGILVAYCCRFCVFVSSSPGIIMLGNLFASRTLISSYAQVPGFSLLLICACATQILILNSSSLVIFGRQYRSEFCWNVFFLFHGVFQLLGCISFSYTSWRVYYDLRHSLCTFYMTSCPCAKHGSHCFILNIS